LLRKIIVGTMGMRQHAPYDVRDQARRLTMLDQQCALQKSPLRQAVKQQPKQQKRS
jgi:hypothetical protein